VPPRQKPNARPPIDHLRHRAQHLERVDRVADGGRDVELARRRHPGLETRVVVVELEARLRAPVQVGGEHDVAEVGQAPGAVAHVVVDAEDLVQQDDPRPAAGRRHREVRLELALRRPDPLAAGGDRRHGAAMIVTSGAWSDGLDPLR
jgi:hypothetical protein